MDSEKILKLKASCALDPKSFLILYAFVFYRNYQTIFQAPSVSVYLLLCQSFLIQFQFSREQIRYKAQIKSLYFYVAIYHRTNLHTYSPPLVRMSIYILYVKRIITLLSLCVLIKLQYKDESVLCDITCIKNYP